MKLRTLPTAELRNLSSVSEEVALQRPLEEVITATLEAAASRSRHTARAYQTAIGLFLQYLDKSKGKTIPEEYQQDWRPFAATYELERERLWRYKGPAAILRLVDGSVIRIQSFARTRR